MRMDELAAPAIAAVREGRVRIHPESQSRRYIDWLSEIRPWCVSRQLWWGHQLPVYYRGEETYVGNEPPPGDGWERDPDVLDTWFSSALWPFATLGWPGETPELSAFYPTDVLLTARDILFLWVARMVMMGLRFAGDIPFEHVYVHSVIQAPDGRRMSKSLGTGIDPLEEIERHGADAVRFGLLAMSSTQDVRYSAEKVRQGQALANKLFNASRFVLLNVSGSDAEPRPAALEDRWILSRLQVAKSDAARRIAEFDFAKLALGLYDFVYGELCDWYLELVKGREFDDDLSGTMLHVLRETLTLAHPMIPFVTEEIWAHVPGADGLLAQSRRGEVRGDLLDADAEARVGALIDSVREIRGWREAAGVAPGERLAASSAGFGELRDPLARLARLEWGDPGPDAVTVGGIEVAAPSVDLAALETRRTEERARLQAEVDRAEAKLANQGFVGKAPAAVVQAERDKLASLLARLEAA
jgi:valyl-tRNA synthetase